MCTKWIIPGSRTKKIVPVKTPKPPKIQEIMFRIVGISPLCMPRRLRALGSWIAVRND